MKKFSEIKYKKINIEKVSADLNALIDEFKNAETFEAQNKALEKVNKLSNDLSTNMQVAEIRYTLDTRSKLNQRNKQQLDELGPVITGLFNRFQVELVNAKFRPQLEEKWGKHLFNMTQNALECFDEKIIPELQEDNALSSEYTKVIAEAKIEFRGEIYNLSQLSKYVQSTDRATRREASLAVCKFFEDNNERIGDIYDKMVKVRTRMAHKLGYENYVELGYKALGRTDYDKKMVEGYREQIYRDLVPLTNKLFKEQAKRLGIKNPQFYDYSIHFKSGNAIPDGDKDFLVKQATTMYHELSEETDTFFTFMKEYELLDLETRPGKAGGGYMTYLPKYKAPFIFSNFNGTSGDVDVLTHEFGHAFQGYMSRNIKCPDYHMPTMEACEIHSMSMEFITYPWMNLFFGENEAKYRYTHLADAITFIPYGATVDEFQHWVYENPEVTHAERCAKWREIEKKYLPHRVYDEAPILESGAFWLRQGHIFGSPFYYIDYTLAQVVAFQFFIENEKNHEKAWKKYVKLCKMGGKYPFTELLQRAHLNNPFVDGTIKKIVRPLTKYLKSIDISNY